MVPRIMLVDDYPLFRRGMADSLRHAAAVHIVGEADADSAESLIGEFLPDIVLLGCGLAILDDLVQAHPPVRILVLGPCDDLESRLAARAAGAHGYLSKRATDTELLAGIHALWAGHFWLDLDAYARKPSPLGLTARERDVVLGIAHGYTNREIADVLDLSIKSVESYRARVMQKFGFHSRADLVRYAFHNGLMAAQPVRG